MTVFQIGRRLCLWGLSGWMMVVQAQPSDPALGESSVTSAARMPRAAVLSGLGEQALAQRYPEQAVWLDLGDEGRALGLLMPEQRFPGAGALLVLADEGQTADAGVLGPLRLALAERGIAVMTVGLRLPPESVQRSRLAQDGAEERKASGVAGRDDVPAADAVMIDVEAGSPQENAVSDFRDSVRARLNAGFEALLNEGYERPGVIGLGWSADYVTEWAGTASPVAAVIWLAPRFPAQYRAPLSSFRTSGVAGGEGWAVLDLHGSEGRAGEAGRARASALGRAGVTGYQRQGIVLGQPPQAQDAARIASRISAWFRNQ
ncbi:alpha/beta hydrolase family protein [Marinobacter daepoensis]|uniref:DUF3530 family protein n=1 Tax=Marinobacter daepoensis TaxID=262077 RepID=UPI001C9893CB|nr:alpha/beta hydrolase family protein [Marinobacter daepoensis]